MGREIYDIINDMAEVLNASQMQKLQEVLAKRLSENTVYDYLQTTNMDFLDMLLTAKHLEGCSDKIIRYYRCNIEKMLDTINIPVIKITTEMLRKYLVEYQTINNCGKVTIDNIRRSLSTFFSWLEEEDYIIKSPMKRIHKVKTAVIVKDTIPDEKIEILRDNCNNLRDRAMIDFLLSTGIRVGDDDDKIRLNQRKPSKYKGLRRFGPEKNLQRINKFMKERPIFYKNLIQMKENIRFYLRCFYCITKVMILQFNSENRTELARNG